MIKTETKVMFVEAARNWLAKNTKATVTVGTTVKDVEPDTVKLVVKGVSLPFDEGLKLLGALEAIRPKDVKIALKFPDA